MTSTGPEQGHPESVPEQDPVGGSTETGSYSWPAGKAELSKRFVAVIIDSVIAVLVGLIPWIGGIISAAYLVLRDGMELEFMDNRSVGKKLMKLRPVTADGGKVDMMMSVRRNWMFGFGGIVAVPDVHPHYRMAAHDSCRAHGHGCLASSSWSRCSPTKRDGGSEMYGPTRRSWKSTTEAGPRGPVESDGRTTMNRGAPNAL